MKIIVGSHVRARPRFLSIPERSDWGVGVVTRLITGEAWVYFRSTNTSYPIRLEHVELLDCQHNRALAVEAALGGEK